jgi:hypothetical protein
MNLARIFSALLTISTFAFPALGAADEFNGNIGVNEVDHVQLQWDSSKINESVCPNINGTVFSFTGNDGRSHSAYKSYLDELEAKLGTGCIRLLRVNINPASNEYEKTAPDGYWRNHNSYSTAAELMIKVIENAKNTWTDSAGNHLANGKTIVVGLSAGAIIAASALEVLPDNPFVSIGPYIPMRFDRTIMLSGPLGADVSVECGIIEAANIKSLLDRFFRTQSCSDPDTYGEVDNSKDVVDISNESFRSYLYPSNEIAIFVGKYDKLGCESVSIGPGLPCQWNALEAVERYIKSIGGGDDSFFTRVSQNSANQDDNLYTHMLYEVEGSHELWASQYVREQVCRHAFDEVNELLGSADKLSLDNCE